MALVCCKPIGMLMCPDDRPSPIFTVFAVVINLGVAVAAGAFALSSDAKDCDDNKLRTWLWIAVMIGIVNIVFACYLYWRVCVKVKEMGIMTAVWKLFLYDIGVCLYLCFFVFMIVWCGLGGQHADSADDAPASTGEPCDQTAKRIRTVIALLIVYMCVGGFLLCFSTFTECCKEPRWKKQGQGQPHAPPPANNGSSSWWPFGRRQQQTTQVAGYPQQQPAPQQQMQPIAYQPQAQPQAQYPQQQMQHPPPQQYQAHPPQQQPYPAQQSYPVQQQYPPQQQAYAPQQQQPYPAQQPQQQEPSMAQKVGHQLGAGIGKIMGRK